MSFARMQLRDIEDIWINLSQIAFFERNQHGKHANRLTVYLSNGMALIIEGAGVPAFLKKLEESGQVEAFPDCEVKDTPVSKRLFG